MAPMEHNEVVYRQALGYLCEQGELNGPVALHIIVLTLLVCSGYEASMFHTRTYNHLLV